MEKIKLPNDYFPHDFNARLDRKILRCRKVLGIEGYGIYWMLIETLCLQENFSYPIKDIDLLADDFGCSVEKVEAVVKQFELFQIDDNAKFFSMSLIARLQKYLDLSEIGRRGANARWDKARKLKELQQINTPAMPPHSPTNTIIEKNIKEYDIKEDNINNNLFDSFWNMYDKKVGKTNAKKQWKKLSEDEIIKVLKILPAYIKSKPDKQYRKDPERFLSHKVFNDEIIESKYGNNKNNSGASPEFLRELVERRAAKERTAD